MTEKSGIDATIGERVHLLMRRQKVTQTGLAARLGVTQSALSRKLHGERAFAVAELLDIANMLDVDITELLPTGSPTNKE